MRKLLDAAMVAFDKRGYHATRVNDVVEIAKTSHGTFYLYFSNKEDLLRALVTEAAGEAQKLYDALSTLPARGRRAAVGRRARLDPGLLGALDTATRRSSASWTDLATIDPELIDVIRETFTVMSGALVQADRARLLGPHHRPRRRRHGDAGHARPLPLPPRVRRPADRRRRPRDDDHHGLPGALRPQRLRAVRTPVPDRRLGCRRAGTPGRRSPSTPEPCRVSPPSTTMFWPVTKRARSEHRKTTTSATSSGSPIRPTGVPVSKRSTWSGMNSNHGAVIAVRIMPGDTALTRMVGPYSRAADAVSAATAALLAA